MLKCVPRFILINPIQVAWCEPVYILWGHNLTPIQAYEVILIIWMLCFGRAIQRQNIVVTYRAEFCFHVKAASPRAKIVKASWIEASHRARVRYPWRRHCLDPAHSSQPESEDEVWDEQLCQQQEA